MTDPSPREETSRALAGLTSALQSRYGDVRQAAAMVFADRGDPRAVEALGRLLHGALEPDRQRRIISALTSLADKLSDASVPHVLLDRIQHDPTETALAGDLLRAVGLCRRPEVADRLVAMIEADPHRRAAAMAALLVISGYDQPLDDPDGQRASLVITLDDLAPKPSSPATKIPVASVPEDDDSDGEHDDDDSDGEHDDDDQSGE